MELIFGTSPKNGRDDNDAFHLARKMLLLSRKQNLQNRQFRDVMTIALLLGFPKQRKSHFNNKEPTLNFVFHANRQCNTELPYR
jgi:hypothetical protein